MNAKMVRAISFTTVLLIVPVTALANPKPPSLCSRIFAWFGSSPKSEVPIQTAARAMEDRTPQISFFQGSEKLAPGTFSEQRVIGGRSIWLTATDRSYKAEFYGRFEPDSSTIFTQHAILAENDGGRRAELEKVLFKRLLDTNRGIKSIRLQLRPPERINIHPNWDYQNKDALQFAQTVSSQIAADSVNGKSTFAAIESDSRYQALKELGFTVDLSKSGIEARRIDDNGHYFLWLTRDPAKPLQPGSIKGE